MTLEVRIPKRRILPLPTRRGLNRLEAADLIGVSPTFFDKLVEKGSMPKPKRVGSRRIWDALAVGVAFDALDGDDCDANPWD